ncbi:thrombospondin type 3 repeat-containing protein [Chryseobacterium schmidteae]|uniref:thrombospondin type 3 repeat-containing protein n=1 Tax=Chryseobacterium schmidteae TaxID=2730404 RepID=UPI00158CD76D|nr:thrombospondin type 3 repeat-containing protein [Chryseobacterium schmidteae]
MIKNYKILSVFLVLLFSASAFSQQAGKIYLSLGRLGRVYDISNDILNNPSTTARALPSPLQTPNLASNRPIASNLAIGYDAVAGNNSQLVFFHSNVTSGTPLYKNGTAITNVVLPDDIGGIGTNNVIGPYFGYTYGFKTLDKSLYRINPNPVVVGSITGDADWNSGETFGTDTFYDYQNNIYTFVNSNGNRYLYKISIATLQATKVVQLTADNTATTVASIQGMAYLNNTAFLATTENFTNSSNVASSRVTVRSLNMSTGNSVVVGVYEFVRGDGTTGNLDLASVDYFQPFTFTCNNIAFQDSNNYVAGTPSIRTLRVPIANIYTPGNYTINVTGIGFNAAQNVTINSGTTYVDIPVAYNGSGNGGNTNLTIDLNGSTTSCVYATFIDKDTDGDGIRDMLDLDSDNDGILDIFECPDYFVNQPFNSSGGTTVNFSAPAADLGFIFDVFTLDNSFNLNINGVKLAVNEIQFQQDQTDNIRFADGDRYGNGSVPQIYNMTGTSTNPLVRIIIHKNGSINMYGSKSGGTKFFPLELYNGNSFNTIVWNTSGANSVTLSQSVVGTTYITGNGYGVKHGFCDPDNDGVSNQFDVDSDGDGCPDAIEGSENVKYTQVHALSLLSSDPNYKFRGQIKVLGNGTTSGNPNQVVSTKPEGYGVPLLVNSAFGNNTNTAGVADNTDGTVDVGQGVGNSQTAALNDCKCYNLPNTTTGADNSTQHGITAFNRAGGANSNWPMLRNNGWTALEANTKALVINRMPSITTGANAGEPLSGGNPAITTPVIGMMYYDTTSDCLKINTDGTRSGWKCFGTQSCPAEN